MPPDVSTIKPGSILLYNTPGDLIDELITRTGPAAHVEWYEGAGKSLASGTESGVGRYDFRSEGLIGVLERDASLDQTFDFVAAFSAWFETVNGDAYAWKSLAGFILDEAIDQPKALVCSAFVSLGFMRIGCPLFNKLWSCSLITPSDFFKSVALKWAWVDTSQIYKVAI